MNCATCFENDFTEKFVKLRSCPTFFGFDYTEKFVKKMSHCGVYMIFWKISVKTTSLVKSLLQNWFHEIILKWYKTLVHYVTPQCKCSTCLLLSSFHGKNSWVWILIVYCMNCFGFVFTEKFVKSRSLQQLALK